ncbi:MAG: SusD/RagB family nutrient-binding outer membrane lipoprotein [Bacteroidales bacterium]|nr:SusD/RagB family nutrient-binding outer membrane lipoprotein [Bacteroidales bacterium]
MKKIFISIFAVVLAASVAVTSCTADYLERNTNQEQASESDLDYDNNRAGSYLSQMMANVLPTYQKIGDDEYGSASYQVVQGLSGDIFSGYQAANKPDFDQNNVYNLRADGWAGTMFEDVFVRCIAAWTRLDAIRETNGVAAALADVLKVAALHRVTDAYGPIPYSSIGKALHLNYDSQQEVYTAMFADLGNAIDVLTPAAINNTLDISRFDNVFYGDLTKWVQFANTLRLRLALRVYYADQALYNAQAQAAIGNTLGFLTENAAIHPASGASWENPLYVIAYNFNDGDAKAGASILCYMNGYSDPRRDKYFVIGKDKQGNAAFVGMRMGVAINGAYAASDRWSYIKADNSDPLMWMSGAESYFLLAEHYLRQNSPTQAQTWYENGIRRSFELWGVDGATNYLAVTAAPATYTDPVTESNSYSTALTDVSVAWSSQTTTEKHLEQIITQKYIAMFPEGMEAWAEFRRSGYPKLIPTVQNRSNGTINTAKQVRRLVYPASESQANAANLAEGIEILNQEASGGSGDNGGTQVWWDKR